MQITDNEKLGASTLPRSSSSLGVPIKKRPIVFPHSPSPPPSPPPQSSLHEDAVCAENHTSRIPVHFKDDLATEGKKDPILNSAKLQVKAITSDVGRNHAKFSNVDNKCTPHLVMESALLVQALKETSVPIANGEGQLVRSDTSALRRVSTMELQLATKCPTEVPMDGQVSERKCMGQLKLGSVSLDDVTPILDQQKDNDTTINTEVDVTCDHKNVARLNWDLNTPMEAWESAVNDFSDLKAVEQVQGEQDGIPKSYAQLQLRESSETDYIACGKDLPLNGEPESTSTPISATRQENLGSKALLDLQLKPSYDGKHNMEMLSQTVSVDLITPIGSSLLETSRVVKDEPYENGNQQGYWNREMVGLNLVLPQVVKPEPLEGTDSEACKTTYCGFKVSPSRIIKSEPTEGFSEEFGKEHRRWLSIAELNNQKLVSHEIGKSQDVSQCVDKALDLISECAKVNRPQNGKRISDEPMPSVLDIKVLHDSNELPTGSGISQEITEPIGNPLKGISKSQKVEVKDLNLNSGAQEIAGGVPSEAVLSDEKQHPTRCSMSEFDAVPGSSEKKILSASEVDSPFEHPLGLGALGNVGVDTGSDMDISDDDMPVGTLDTGDAAVKLRYTVHNDLDEAEEARNPAPDSRFGGVSPERHGNNVGQCISSVDAPMSLLKHPDEDVAAECVVKSSNGMTSHHGDSSVGEKNPSICNVASESSDTLEHADKTVKKENMHGTDRLQQDHVKNDKGPAAKSKSSQAPGTNKVQLTDLSSKLESSTHSDAMEQSNFRSKGRRFLTSDKVSQFGKFKYIPGRFLASKSAKEKAIDSSYRRDRPDSRGSRDEICNERPRRFENDRYLYEAAGKGGEHVGHLRRRGDENLDASHGDRAHGLGQGSTSFRFRRSKDASELSIESDGFIGNNSRNFRKPMNDGLQYIPSRVPFRRHSPGSRAKIPADIATVRHPINDVSPVRGPGRISHDFIPFNHDDKLLRTFPDEIMDHHLFSHPFMPYEQDECAFIRRGRRSMSPPAQRRGSHMHRIYLDSYRRSPSEFDGHADIIRCRSPPLIRHDRMRSPPRDPYIREEMLVRRCGSPSYVDRLPDEIEVGHPREHMMELVPSREHEVPRPGRGPDRSIRRFDMVDPRVIEEEECFRPLFHEEIHEISEDECIDGRLNFGGRGGHVRSVRQRLGPRNDGDNFVFENGPHRPSRFCSEGSEEFRERTQDYSGRFRNRLGNMHCRPRGILEHEDNLIRHEEQGRRDVPPSDLRLKRRRF